MTDQSFRKSRWLTGTALGTAVAAAAMVFGSVSAQAGSSAPPVQASHVADNGGADIGGGITSYEFTVFNDGASGFDEYAGVFVDPIIVDWELPYFPADNVDLTEGTNGPGLDPDAMFNIRSPLGWAFAIEEIGQINPDTGWDGVASWQDPLDPFFFGPNSPFTTATHVLHWYIDPDGLGGDTPLSVLYDTFGIHASDSLECGFGQTASLQLIQVEVEPLPCNALAGFGFDSIYPAVAAPYQASWAQLPIQSGDPAFPLAGQPNSPSVQVPEPESGILLATGLLALGGWYGRRRRRQS